MIATKPTQLLSQHAPSLSVRVSSTNLNSPSFSAIFPTIHFSSHPSPSTCTPQHITHTAQVEKHCGPQVGCMTITDNGCGIPGGEEGLKSFATIGFHNERPPFYTDVSIFKSQDIGMHGLGGKAAAYAIGQSIQIETRALIAGVLDERVTEGCVLLYSGYIVTRSGCTRGSMLLLRGVKVSHIVLA